MDGSLPCLTTSREPLTSAYSAWVTGLAPWSLYLTLTYDGRKWYSEQTPPSSWAAARHIRRYHAEATSLFRRPVYLAATQELTRAGWPHWHGLLAAGAISATEFAALSQAWFAPHGFAHFARIQSGTQAVVCQYVSKYLVKDNSEIALLGPWQSGRAILQSPLAAPRARGRTSGRSHTIR